MNGAECVVRTLMSGGVDVCFANPGTSEMALVAALDKTPGIKCILGLFEGVVTGAADGYARMAGKPAASLLHCGPGMANGLANLHNARRAGVPLINIVGDQATYHRSFYPPLTSDAESAARPFSDWVRYSLSAQTIGPDIASAIETANAPPGNVATLIVPADVAWSEGASVRTLPQAALPAPVSDPCIKRVVSILKSGEPTALLLGGHAALEAGLRQAGKIHNASGVKLLGQMFNTRISRGGNLPALELIPYDVDQALHKLKGLKHLILVGARAPVAFFAYPGRPSGLAPADCEITVLAGEAEDAVGALGAVAESLGPGSPLEARQPVVEPGPATGVLTPDAISQSMGTLLPEAAVVVDESLTSGQTLYASTFNAPPHDWLQLTGGAIGIGIPLATGAAVACPKQRVVCLQADGSGMYTVQGLWTQARENLNITTVIYANRSYAILKKELANMGVEDPGQNATDMMDLGRPDLDWVHLARGLGVEGKRVSTVEAFNDAFRASLKHDGPFLIEAALS